MAAAPRNQLPSGHDEQFVNAVDDDFQCLICHLPLKEPVLTRCGHRFCKDCLEEHFRRQRVQNQPLTCPADREGLDQDRDVFPDKATERKILSLAIKCSSEGCDWTGELRNKEVHLASCLFKFVSCTNENCHVTVQRRNLNKHVTITCPWRILQCDHCDEPHPECPMQDHIAQCNKVPVSCPNNCGGSFPREMISNHMKDDCPLTLLPCPYVKMGCRAEVQRKQVESHLQSAVRLHLDLACAKLNNTEVELNITKAKLNITEIKLGDTEKKTKELMKKFDTLKRELHDTQLNLEKANKQVTKFDTKQAQFSQELNFTKVMLNDTQEKLETAREQMNKFDKQFVWKIDNFGDLLQQAKAGEETFVSSVPFYSCSAESCGYKLKVRIVPNGDGTGKNTHLSVYICVMKGDYDAILPWPFKKKVTFTLIDQQEDPVQRENVTLFFISNNIPKCFARPTQEENSGLGYPEFLSHEKLHSRRYIVDDTLFLQAEIGP